MPRDGIADEVENAIDPLTALPAWVKGEKRLSMMLPYVSLVNDRTIRTRGNELMQCIRLEGVNSTTSEDGHLDRIGGLLAGIVAQVGTEFSFYLHKVSKAVDVTLPPIPGEGFAAITKHASLTPREVANIPDPHGHQAYAPPTLKWGHHHPQNAT